MNTFQELHLNLPGGLQDILPTGKMSFIKIVNVGFSAKTLSNGKHISYDLKITFCYHHAKFYFHIWKTDSIRVNFVLANSYLKWPPWIVLTSNVNPL